jgi:outer membrane protein assembly factor BamB
MNESLTWCLRGASDIVLRVPVAFRELAELRPLAKPPAGSRQCADESLKEAQDMKKTAIGVFAVLVSMNVVQAGENWPQWRGPALDGTSDSTNLPVSWSENKNVRWKTPLPSWSAATPVVWGDRVFVMSGSPADKGEKATTKPSRSQLESEGQELLLLCVSRKDGTILWRKKLDEGNRHFVKQNMTSPTPATDGKHVWAMTGNGVLTALDMEGTVVWHREFQKDYGAFGLDFGYASSPLLWDGKLIVQVLHGSDTENLGYIVALDPETGKNIWKVDRRTDAVDESPDCYTSPAIMRYTDRVELILGGADYITAHDPADGKEIWRCGGLNPEANPRYRSVSSPVVAGELVFMSVRNGPTVACKGGGQGNVTATHHAWTNPAAPEVPTPVCDGKYLYILHDPGMFTCLDAKTGEAKYLKQRLPAGQFSASPLLADGRLYLTSEKAHTTVLAAGPEFKVLGENQLDNSHTLSSIAVAGQELFIRTGKFLYCISEGK